MLRLNHPAQRKRRHPPGIVIGIPKPLPGAVVIGHIPRHVIGKAAGAASPEGDGLQTVIRGQVAIAVGQQPGAGVQVLCRTIADPVIGIVFIVQRRPP